MTRFSIKPFWDPFEDFDSFFDRTPAVWDEDMKLSPAVDVRQTDKDVVVEASMPGMNEDDVDISIEDDVLTIKGESEKKEEVKKEDYFRKEIRKGSFSRVITLPVTVVANDAKAEFKKGILTVTVPKAEPVKESKKVKVDIEK